MVFRVKSKKVRFARRMKERKWAPAWAAFKKYGRPVHPSRITVKKRSWRRHTIDE